VKDQLLEIDVRLLVLRYGREQVLNVLARLGEQSPEQLEQYLRTLEHKPTASRTERAKRSLVEIAARESKERSDISEPLRTLAINFENRTFLPNLRDVHRFLNGIGISRRTLKSRAVAGPVVIRALSKLSRERLLELVAHKESSNESDYSLLSRAIMGKPLDTDSGQE
jgi:hypothetical protein